jgi:hypothetical protein
MKKMKDSEKTEWEDKRSDSEQKGEQWVNELMEW